MTSLNPWDFVFGLVTTFVIYVVILAIEFLLHIENLFIGKQDSVVWVFLEHFYNFLQPSYSIFLSLVSNKWLTECLYVPRCKSSCKIWLKKKLETFILTVRCVCFCTGFHLKAWLHMLYLPSNELVFAQLQVVCIGALSFHKPIYSLLGTFHLLLLTRAKECEYSCKPIHVFVTYIRLYLPSNFQYKQPYCSQLHCEQCPFPPLHLYSHIYEWYSHIFLVQQYSCMYITLSAITRVS